jgi:hypothetical protein
VTSRANLGRPLFLVLFRFSFLTLAPVVKIPEGVVVGFQNFGKIKGFRRRRKQLRPHSPLYYELKRGVFSKVVLGFRNFGYDF